LKTRTIAKTQVCTISVHLMTFLDMR